jgi:hypothetical protein
MLSVALIGDIYDTLDGAVELFELATTATRLHC